MLYKLNPDKFKAINAALDLTKADYVFLKQVYVFLFKVGFLVGKW
jgi:hypothetical protein